MSRRSEMGEIMATDRTTDEAREVASGWSAPAAGEEVPELPLAWEQIANGRYMPRRIRGSCLGRELG